MQFKNSAESSCRSFLHYFWSAFNDNSWVSLYSIHSEGYGALIREGVLIRMNTISKHDRYYSSIASHGASGARLHVDEVRTTSNAYKITPLLHTSALRPSYFSPWKWQKENNVEQINT